MKSRLFFLYLFTLFVVLVGCRAEIENEITKQDSTKPESKISFSQFKNETRVENTLQAYSNQSSRISKEGNILSTFKIDTTHINRLDFKKKVTYSFRAYNIFESPDKKYNVVYFYKNNKWNFSLLEMLSNKDIKLIYDSRYGNLQERNNTSTSRTCVQAITVAHYHCTCKSTSCDECSECISYVTENVVYDCDGGSSGGVGGPKSSDSGDSDSNSGGGNGGSYTDPSGYVFDPFLPPSTDPEYIRASRAYSFFFQLTSVGYTAQKWASENSSIYMNILENYLDNYNVTNNVQNLNFANWSVAFFMQNPQTTWQQFENWFMGTPELENIEEINPNLIQYETPIIQQALPSLNNWNTYFPKIEENGYWKPMESPDVYKLAGGTLYNSHLNDKTGAYQNACAIRGSRALLYSGITIPVIKIPGNPQRQLTQKGSDNKNYILAATSFEKFMIDIFGDTSYRLTGTDANDPQKVKNLLQGKNGIYVIINADPRPTSQGGAGYSGHVDNIVNGICISGAYTNPKGGVKSIRIWILD